MDIISIEDTIADDIDDKITSSKLYRFVDELSDEREKTIIVMRYGLYNSEPLTQKQIAKKLNISRSYVSRIEKKALQKLRKKLLEPTSEYMGYKGGSYDRYSRGVEGGK